jgi:PPM family protein phosphatase
MKISYRARSDAGPVRALNEDDYAVGEGQPALPPGLLFVVCDGRGGPNLGDAAARLTADTISATYYTANEPDPPQALRDAFQMANQRIYQRWGRSPTRVTAVAALVIAEQTFIASVGDCRAYHFHDRQLRQITTDHTFYEELMQQGMLTREDVQRYTSNITRLRALGESVELKVDLFGQVLQPDEALLLCTDGLHDYVEDREIEETLATAPPAEAVDRLIDLVYVRDGRDNVTAILIWREE